MNRTSRELNNYRERKKEDMKNYYTNAEYTIPRAKNDAVREALANEFKPIEASDIFYSRIDFVLDTINNNLVEFDQKKYPNITLEEKWDRFIDVWQFIPSSLALYRLICAFGYNCLQPTHVDGYKGVWAVELQHKETGVKLCVGDNKGGFAFSICTDSKNYEDVQKVGLRFLSLLIDKNFTHTYDRTIAGSVA
jgi:hypothetical protein